LSRAEVVIPANGNVVHRVVLQRLVDLPARGWWSGDLHVHMNYGGAYRNTPRHLAFQARAEDLHVVENLIVNKEQRIPDIAYFRTDADPASGPGFVLMHAQEFHTSTWGHMGLLALSSHYILPEYAGYPNTAAASLYPHNAAIADLAHAQGGLVGYVHPFDSKPNPADTTEPVSSELPVDVALARWTTSRSWGTRITSSRRKSGTACSTAASGCRRGPVPTRFRTSPACAVRPAWCGCSCGRARCSITVAGSRGSRRDARS